MNAEALPHLIVHPLPAAPTFTGRERELQMLQEFWQEGHGVASLIGLGGAGKTALTAHFVSWLMENNGLDGLLVWSFYDDPDANEFLKTAYTYFCGAEAVPAAGAGWFSQLAETLSAGGKYLIVLDGLERVQLPQTDATGIYGEVEDPLLRGLLIRIAAGAGNCKAIITSRFPVSSIERWNKRGYEIIDINQLSPEAARSLLQSHGVKGSNKELDSLINQCGGHALTMDLLGGAIGGFFNGDVSKAPKLEAEMRGEGAHGARLARVLEVYEKKLPQREFDLLSRLCVFRFGVDIEALVSIFRGEDRAAVAGSLAQATEEEIEQALAKLEERHLVYREPKGRFTIHPAVRDYFYSLFREPATFHQAVHKHLTSLSKRPGIGLPTDKEALDLLEELVFHAIQAGSVNEAIDIYMGRMGGSTHLNATLGEYTRTYRILRAFEDCPDRTGMYHCLRAFGQIEEALNWRPTNRYTLLLLGRLTELAKDSSKSTSAIARYLQGEEVPIPERTPDVPIPAALLYLIGKEVDEAARVAQLEIQHAVNMDDKVRNKLLLAEVDRCRGDYTAALQKIDECSEWALNSSSQEHICLLELVRARLTASTGNAKQAMQTVDEAIRSARDSDFRLFLALLLVDKARLHVDMGETAKAIEVAKEAEQVANDPDVGFEWAARSAREVIQAASA